jgi:hypothetical protein
MVTCPDCRGGKIWLGLVAELAGAGATLRCRFCEGAGVVDEASAARRREGERRRRERVRRGESQCERAAIMGSRWNYLMTSSMDGSTTGVHGARSGEQPTRSCVNGVSDDASGPTVIN